MSNLIKYIFWYLFLFLNFRERGIPERIITSLGYIIASAKLRNFWVREKVSYMKGVGIANKYDLILLMVMKCGISELFRTSLSWELRPLYVEDEENLCCATVPSVAYSHNIIWATVLRQCAALTHRQPN